MSSPPLPLFPSIVARLCVDRIVGIPIARSASSLLSSPPLSPPFPKNKKAAFGRLGVDQHSKTRIRSAGRLSLLPFSFFFPNPVSR